MNVDPFSNPLIVVISALMLLALPYAALGTFGPKATNVVLPFHIVLAVFSAAPLVLTLIKHRLLRSTCMRSVIVTESILRNGGKAGMLDD